MIAVCEFDIKTVVGEGVWSGRFGCFRPCEVDGDLVPLLELAAHLGGGVRKLKGQNKIEEGRNTADRAFHHEWVEVGGGQRTTNAAIGLCVIAHNNCDYASECSLVREIPD